MASKILKGDTVEVITGEHKGERGEVKSVDGKAQRVVVHNVNMVKKHQKPQQGAQPAPRWVSSNLKRPSTCPMSC